MDTAVLEHRLGMEEAEGFPDALWFFEPPRVTISAQQPSGTVLLKFGPKAGVLTGMVIDARTGKPVLAGFTLRRLNDSWFLSSSLTLTCLLPLYRGLQHATGTLHAKLKKQLGVRTGLSAL